MRSLRTIAPLGPRLLSPERVVVSYAASERLAQPVRQGPGGVWVVTRVG